MDESTVPPARELPPERLLQRKELLMSEIATAPPAARAGRRPLVLAFAVLAALAAATGFGAYALTRDEPTHVDSIGCYSRASTSADVAVIGNTAADPIAACAELWRRGHIAEGVSAAPALQACVLETGAVAVVPGSGAEACHGIGAAQLSAQGRRELRLLGGLQAALVERLGSSCVPAERAQAVARRELAARGLDEWSVRVADGYAGDRPCASPTLDREARTVVLVPAPR